MGLSDEIGHRFRGLVPSLGYRRIPGRVSEEPSHCSGAKVPVARGPSWLQLTRACPEQEQEPLRLVPEGTAFGDARVWKRNGCLVQVRYHFTYQIDGLVVNGAPIPEGWLGAYLRQAASPLRSLSSCDWSRFLSV